MKRSTQASRPIVLARTMGLALVCISAISFLGYFPGPVSATPVGRAWAPVETVSDPSISGFGSLRVEVDSTGKPMLIASARSASTAFKGWTLVEWRDSTWRVMFEPSVPSGFFPEPVLSLDARQYLVWIYPDPQTGDGLLLFAPVTPYGVAEPETTLVTTTQSWEYSAAVSGRSRWVARSQQPALQSLHVQVSVSEDGGPWQELPTVGLGSATCAIAPLDSTRALLVHAGTTGLRWEICEGTAWIASGTIDPRPEFARHPRLRQNPDGRLLLTYTTPESVHVMAYDEGAWSGLATMDCTHAPGETYLPAWIDVSRGPELVPPIAWGDLGVGATFRDIGCIAFPDGKGWSIPEEIPGSESIYTTAFVAVDRNGDTWTAWNRLLTAGIWFTHTYVSATAEGPALRRTPGGVRVDWTLSEPAPGSNWAVLRSGEGAGWTLLSRVRADSTVQLTWTDPEPVPGPAIYKVRRESVDRRYQWDSAEVPWTEDSAGPAIRLRSRLPLSGDHVEFSITGGAVGPMVARLHDVQGRTLLAQQRDFVGAGNERVFLNLTGIGLRSGVFFLRITDARGRTSNAEKLVIVR